MKEAIIPTDRRLRIAMLSIHSSPIGPLGTRDTGGMSVYVRELARYLGSCGIQVDIFTHARGEDQTLFPNVRLIHLAQGLGRSLDKEALPAHLPYIFDALDRYRRHLHQDYDLIHSHYWLSGVVGAMAQARWHCPHITMFHTLAKVKNHTHSGENEPDLRIAHEQWLAKTADRILVPTAREKNNLLNDYHTRTSKISIVPCGVDLDLFAPMDRSQARQALGFEGRGPLLLYVGRFAALKGLDQLVRSMAQLGRRFVDLQLAIVGGDGPDAPATLALRALAEELGLMRRIHFTGPKDQQLLPAYYNAADILVLPSHYESFGLVILEALACGTPVAATDVGIASAVIQAGVSGKIISAPDHQAVTDAVTACLEWSQARFASRQTIRASVTRFGWQQIAAAVTHVYAEVLAAHDPALADLHPEACGIIPN